MSDSEQKSISPLDTTEAFETLVQLAGRKTLPIPSETLVGHVLALPGNWDWPVRRAAFDAMMRRLASARSQELKVSQKPDSAVFGRYILRSPQGELPYELQLYGLSPRVVGRCSCPDFLRSSLGLCKHLFAVLDGLAKKPQLWKLAVNTPPAPMPLLTWDATAIPPDGFDSLNLLALDGDQNFPPRALRECARLFRQDKSGRFRLARTHATDPKARLQLISLLQKHFKKDAADPTVRALLADEHDRAQRLVMLQSMKAKLISAMGQGKRRLYSYQKEGIARFLAQGRLVLADDMGLGKTTQAIVGANALLQAGLVRKGLLIVPASLKAQWDREWRAVSDGPLAVVEGTATDRQTLYRKTTRGFLVTNYEQVMRDFAAISEWNPDLVILDEAQRIKNWSTRTALTIKQLRPKYRLVLTGTPMENRLEELASIVEWVDDRALEPKWRLSPSHSSFADGKREVVGARNLVGLRSRLNPVLLRRVRTEVLAQLPPRQDTVIPVELTYPQRDAHDELNLPIAKLAAIARRRPLTPEEFLKLMALLNTQRIIANGMAQLSFTEIWPDLRKQVPTPRLMESLSAPKLQEFRELVANLVVTQKRKLVVFSQWRRMLELAAWSVSDLLATEGISSRFFTGSEGIHRRTQNLVDFHDDPMARVLFLTDAGGVGLNLQKAANACINLELPWNPAVLEQRIGRIHRMGQKRPIDVYNFVSQACIEERIFSIVADKRALFRGIFEGNSDELKFDRSTTLLKMLEHLVPASLATPPIPTAPSEAPVHAPLEDPSDTEADVVVSDIEAQTPTSSRPGNETEFILPMAPTAEATQVARLFESLRVERGADGGLRIDAPPHAANALASLFEGMARLLSTFGASPPASPVSNDQRTGLPS